jgi:hydrogenase expression/formation protein HypD
MRLKGADIRIIYNISQALEIAKSTGKEVIHFAVGFETTAPSTAAALQESGSINNFSILSSHRITPPAMESVLSNSRIDAVLCPGHVAMVIGAMPFDLLSRKYKIPCVVSGFEPADILESILRILERYGEDDYSIINQYDRVVEYDGNILAQDLINQTYALKGANWRGVGWLPESRLVLKDEYSRFDAEKKFEIKGLEKIDIPDQSCMCGEVLKGTSPKMCPNFMKTCTPSDPKGPCMISNEGACNIAFLNS